MKEIKLKNPTELKALILNLDEKTLYEYIDKLHSTLLDYQLIINSVAHYINDSIGKVKYGKIK